MLFFLNRIDAFRRGPDWEEEARSFINKTTERIRNAVAEALPEYEAQARSIDGHPLSTLPALHAWEATNKSTDRRTQVLTSIDRHFSCLIPLELIDELPRNVAKWDGHTCRQVAQGVWKSSYGDNLDRILAEHINSNFPQLILPHLLEPVAEAAKAALDKAHKITSGRIKVILRRYDEEVDRLDRIRKDLSEMHDKTRAELTGVLNGLDVSEDIVEDLTGVAQKLEGMYSIEKRKLVPFYDWSNKLGKTIDDFFMPLYDAILKNADVPRRTTSSLSPSDNRSLSEVISSLRSAGYDQWGRDGGHIETDSKTKQDQLSALNRSLNDLADVLARCLDVVLAHTACLEAERVHDSLSILVGAIVDSINRKTHEIAPDLTGLAMLSSPLNRVTPTFKFLFRFVAGFPIHTERKQIRTGWERKKVGEKRLWYTLWLKKKDIYEDKPVCEERRFDNAVIPPLIDIFDGLIRQAKSARPEVTFADRLRSQLNQVVTAVATHQQKSLEEYRQQLDEAKASAHMMKEQEREKWMQMDTRIRTLETKFPGLSQVGWDIAS